MRIENGSDFIFNGRFLPSKHRNRIYEDETVSFDYFDLWAIKVYLRTWMVVMKFSKTNENVKNKFVNLTLYR